MTFQLSSTKLYKFSCFLDFLQFFEHIIDTSEQIIDTSTESVGLLLCYVKKESSTNEKSGGK